MTITFRINGKKFFLTPSTVPIDTSLNTFIRNHAHLRGTKFMCLEGGCGACMVNVSSFHPVSGDTVSYAVNSCLFPVFACHGLDIVTVEGIGDEQMGYHATQKVLAHFNGTQCGYCSPGMVMNMYSLLESKKGQVSMAEVENAFGGNICRCTGYRPILDAFKSLAYDAEPRLKQVCMDIEDLTKICPKTGGACAGKCSAAGNVNEKKGVHMSFAEDKEWHKVYYISDVFAIFEKIGTKPYMLVAGNTAHGVYRRCDKLQVFIDVSSIEELRSHSLGSNLIVGANVSLTELMSILSIAASKNPNFAHCTELVKHIDLIANVPVRNTGTIAGNLSIKNQHKEFPSDLYLILEAVGATLIIAESIEETKIVTPSKFINMDMNKKLILSITIPPFDPKTHVFRSFKIMPRAQNAHAYVNSAFLFKFNISQPTLQFAKICFGGIHPNLTHAKATETYLTGKNIFHNDTIQNALRILSDELTPDWILPDASPEFRKSLALSLFYKFILNIAAEKCITIKPEFVSGGTVLDRPVSTGSQQFDTIPQNWPLTKNIPKIEGLAQTSGKSQFINDIPAMPNELYAALVLATEVNAKILQIDTSEVLKIPGVLAFYSAKDIPGKNEVMPFKNICPEKEEIFCSGKVLYHGHPVGVIVAESFELANRASKLVKITYELSNDPVLSTVSKIIDHNRNDRIIGTDHGFIGQNFEHSSHGPMRVSGQIDLGLQYHYYMETQTCICIPVEYEMDIYPSTQWVDLVQIAISQMLNIPENRLNIHVRRLGGSYGGKASRSIFVACACALAAHLTKRPVRLIMTLESNMAAIGKRYGCHSKYEVSFSKEGRIQKLYNKFIHDSGSSYNETPFYINDYYHNCYANEGFKIEPLNARTDIASNTWLRAPASVEATAMIETIMEHVAHATGLDPLDVRMSNIADGSKMIELLPQFRQDVQYDDRKAEVNRFNQQNRWRKRGIAIVPMRYKMCYLGALHALVSIYHGDGTVSIAHGGIEMGQGLNTKAAQVAAHVLGIPLEMIVIKPTNNLISPNAVCTQASYTSEAVGYAIKKACEILLTRIHPIREKSEDASWKFIIEQAHRENIDLSATYMYKESELQPYIVWGLSCAEVEIDVLTGNLQITRVDILEDTGESLSPGIDVGQIEGAFVMGLGYFLTEKIIFDPTNGELLTNRSWNYKPPGAKDIPIDFRIRFLQNSPNPVGVLRSKITGEPASVMSVVVLFAIRHALISARTDADPAGDKWVSLGAPTTPELIHLLTGNSIEQYKLS
ncbi:xanthine dehydrogenase/oxidase-like [Ochlerotatus camptorhynchus]|uniref:xanthine dehydrogenase/oxidase-like n=1 Tax=Ochlerotatus camptorhynchus TaxID=644619 RepID=UPI0031DBA071